MAAGDERRAIGRTNEAARRSIGTNNEAARRAIGTNNEAARRAIGSGNAAARRGEAVVEDIRRLTGADRPARRSLPTLTPVGAVPARTGRGVYKAPPAVQPGGGIASPLSETLDETGQPDRDYWPAQTLTSTDGLLVFQLRAVKTLRMTDANGDAVVFNYAQFADETDETDETDE